MLTLGTKFRPDEPQAFDIAHRAGIHGVEFWLDARLLRHSEAIVSTAHQYPFRYVLHFPNEGALDADSLNSTAYLYKELSCRAIVIHQPMYDQYGRDLLAIEPTLRLAVENHGLDKAGFNCWAEENRWLTLDVEHLWMSTLQDAPLDDLLACLDQFLSRHGEKLRHVHLPGYEIGGREHRPIHYGAKMATAVLGHLAAHGYSELVVSEADIEYHNFDELRQDAMMFENWRSARCGGGGASG
jgi:sugar phosphate isomerase/epimerase